MDRIFHLGSHSFLDTMFLSLFFWDFPRPTHILKKKKKNHDLRLFKGTALSIL